MKKTIEYQNVHENRRYKDTLFRMVFKEKENLLALYNAVNGTGFRCFQHPVILFSIMEKRMNRMKRFRDCLMHL